MLVLEVSKDVYGVILDIPGPEHDVKMVAMLIGWVSISAD